MRWLFLLLMTMVICEHCERQKRATFAYDPPRPFVQHTCRDCRRISAIAQVCTCEVRE